MKVLICDDVMQDAQETKEIIQKNFSNSSLEIIMASPQEVSMSLEENILKCEIVIMDIYFKNENFDGIELVTKINEKLPACQIIYLTSILEFAPKVYDTMHCYFVMKENIEMMLPRALRKAISSYDENINEGVIEILSGGHKMFLSQKDITYIERDDRLLKIHSCNQEYSCYTSLRQMEKSLSSRFARCHGGFIVNLDYVTGLEKQEVLLASGNKLPVGKRFYDAFKLRYLNYFAERI